MAPNASAVPAGRVPTLEYRRDIEGLRAVAVLLVVLAHAKLPLLDGGFIGVDVFLVLSGYLISGLLLVELGRTGKVDFPAFYARRLKRLLPGLLLMLVLTSLAATFVLAPHEQLSQAPAAAAAAAWVSNLYFTFARLDYFAPEADANLYLHTWSLGVEEQFYLVWPALLVFLLGAWRWQGGGFDLRRLGSGLAVAAVLTFALSLLLTYVQPAWGFYLMPSRIWQFALGALVYLHVRRGGQDDDRRDSVAPSWRPAALGWTGMLLIGGSAAAIDHSTPYPGLWALGPSLGTALLLAVGAAYPRSLPVALLSQRPLEAIGRISYAWYLWHWPVLLLGNALVEGAGLWHRLAFALLALAIAAISHRFVEQPLRTHALLAQRHALVLAGSAVIAASAMAGAMGWKQLSETWTQSPDQLQYAQVRSDLPELYRLHCDDWFYSAEVKLCAFGDPKADRTAVIVGDSIGLQWFPALQQIYARRRWRLLVLTKSACPMVDQTYFYSRIGREYTECAHWREEVLRGIPTLGADLIFIGSAATYPFSPSEWSDGTSRVLDRLSGAAERIFIIHATPRLGLNAPDCLSRRDWRRRWNLPEPLCIGAPQRSRDNDIRLALERAAAGFPAVSVLDFSDIVCPQNRCAAEQDGRIVYRDDAHLATAYVASIAAQVEARIAAFSNTPPAGDPPGGGLH